MKLSQMEFPISVSIDKFFFLIAEVLRGIFIFVLLLVEIVETLTRWHIMKPLISVNAVCLCPKLDTRHTWVKMDYKILIDLCVHYCTRFDSLSNMAKTL